MATRQDLDLKSRFVQIREEIKRNFEHVQQLVEERKNDLLQILEDILSEYEKNNEEYLDAIAKLESHKKQLTETLDNDLLDNLVTKQVSQLNDKRAALRLEWKEPEIHWKWEENRVSDMINSLGIITSGDLDIANDIIVPDYPSMKVPRVCAVSRGKQVGEIWDPRGIAIDHRSGNIYVSDYGANKVSVFSNSYKFSFLFGVQRGSGKMEGPHGIHVFQDKVYVTQLGTHRLQIYTLDGKFLTLVGSHGNRVGEFNCPGDCFIDEKNEDVYVCDSANNRVQVFDAELHFKSILCRKLNDPVRGRVHKNYVVILDHSNPCVHFYSTSGEWFRSIIQRDLQTAAVRRFFSFELDTDGNVVLADINLHRVAIADPRGNITHQFGRNGEHPGEFVCPWGVALTRDGHMIVLSCNGFGCLQVF